MDLCFLKSHSVELFEMTPLGWADFGHDFFFFENRDFLLTQRGFF